MQAWDVQQCQQGLKVKSDDELHSVSEKVKTLYIQKAWQN
jgi:hypothetical protein